MDFQNVKNGLLKLLLTRDKHLRTHKELSKEQQSKLKYGIPRSIVHDWLV